MNISELIRNRWSPREYLDKTVDLKTIYQIFDAARWAHSCFNDQPWRFWIAPVGNSEGRRELESLLAEGNAFAKHAGILGLALAKKTFDHNGKPNAWSEYDLGAASMLVALAAKDHGLSTRFMGGFDRDAARKMVPADLEPMAMFVIGYAKPNVVPPKDRNRRPVEAFAFVENLKKPLTLDSE